MTLDQLKYVLEVINKYSDNSDTKIYVGYLPVKKVELVHGYTVEPATQRDKSRVDEKSRIVITVDYTK